MMTLSNATSSQSKSKRGHGSYSSTSGDGSNGTNIPSNNQNSSESNDEFRSQNGGGSGLSVNLCSTSLQSVNPDHEMEDQILNGQILDYTPHTPSGMVVRTTKLKEFPLPESNPIVTPQNMLHQIHVEQQSGFLTCINELNFDNMSQLESCASPANSVKTYVPPKKKRRKVGARTHMPSLKYPATCEIPKCLQKSLCKFLDNELAKNQTRKIDTTDPKIILGHIEDFVLTMFMKFQARRPGEQTVELERDPELVALFESQVTLLSLNFRTIFHWWLTWKKIEINGTSRGENRSYSAQELINIEKGMYNYYDWYFHESVNPAVKFGTFNFKFDWNCIFDYAKKGLAPSRTIRKISEKVTRQPLKWKLGLSWQYVLFFFHQRHLFYIKVSKLHIHMGRKQKLLPMIQKQIEDVDKEVTEVQEELHNHMSTVAAMANHQMKELEFKKKLDGLHARIEVLTNDLNLVKDMPVPMPDEKKSGMNANC